MICSFKKNINFLLLVVALISCSVFAETDRSCRKKVICADTVKATTICADELIVKTGCCASRTITAKDFMDADGNLSQTFVISEPGKYSLGQNIAFAPVDESTPAINILSNDVYLDLCSNTLTQGNTTPNTYAVQIGEGYNYSDPDHVLKNITITHGSITNFSGIGIFCYNGSFDAPTAQVPFESLVFTDLNILDCGSNGSTDFASGIDFDSAADDSLYDLDIPVAYKNVLIENCNVNRCLGAGAINIFVGDGVVIKDTQANDCSNALSQIGIVAAYDIEARNLQMLNCQGNGTKNLDPDANDGQMCGAFLAQSINVYLSNCQFNDSYGEADVLVGGANLSNVQNGIFENVQFNNPRGGEFAATINGVHMSDGPLQQTQGNGLKFIDCQFNGASVSPTNAVPNRAIQGTSIITARNIEFVNCQACNMITENPNRNAYGFRIGTIPQDPIAFFANGRNFTFTNCVVSDIESLNNTIGYQLLVSNANRRGTQASLDNMVLENCIAERIRSSSSSERVAGIFEGLGFAGTPQGPFPAAFNLFVKNCRVSDVRAGAENPLSAGILVESIKRPNITCNSVSDCDRGVLFTGSDLIFPATLFQLAETFADATTFPPVFIDLTSIPAAAPLQSFSNITQGNSIDIAPSPATIELTRNYIFSPTDLNTLDWQAGDEIVYNNNGGADIGGLVSTTTYYAIVYVPGYAENGVVIDNTVDNCTVSGYEDAKTTTSSAWVNNFAFNCGVPASADANYDIVWSGTAPVYAGDLANYPTGSAKAYNVSLIP